MRSLSELTYASLFFHSILRANTHHYLPEESGWEAWSMSCSIRRSCRSATKRIECAWDFGCRLRGPGISPSWGPACWSDPEAVQSM